MVHYEADQLPSSEPDDELHSILAPLQLITDEEVDELWDGWAKNPQCLSNDELLQFHRDGTPVWWPINRAEDENNWSLPERRQVLLLRLLDFEPQASAEMAATPSGRQLLIHALRRIASAVRAESLDLSVTDSGGSPFRSAAERAAAHERIDRQNGRELSTQRDTSRGVVNRKANIDHRRSRRLVSVVVSVVLAILLMGLGCEAYGPVPPEAHAYLNFENPRLFMSPRCAEHRFSSLISRGVLPRSTVGDLRQKFEATPDPDCDMAQVSSWTLWLLLDTTGLRRSRWNADGSWNW